MNEHINSAQMQQLQTAAERQIGQYIERLELRKWSMQQALERGQEGSALIVEAKLIYDFVAQPFKLDAIP